MKKSYHSIMVPAVDAAMTRHTPRGAFSDSLPFCMALILGAKAIRHNHWSRGQSTR